jgi:hypothetical protein
MSGKYPGGFVTAGAPAGYSVAFNGSSYLTATNNAAYAFGTGDFCVEAWVYLTATPSGQMVVGSTYQTTSSGFSFSIESNVLKMRMLGDPVVLSGTTTVTPNAWHHIAVTRSGTSLKVFLDGAQDGTATNSDNVVLNSTAFNIARLPNNSGFLSGYISNLRVLKGTALYTSTFTPPTQLFPIANTQLLTCQSPSIIDNSINAFAITAVGSAAPSTFTPFAGYTSGASGFNPALGAAAPGVWTLDEATTYQNNRQWPIYDPNFNQTTLMLHGNQPVGVTDTNNNVFKDSSSNNFTITRNGNTTQNTFSPFSQTGWSTYFTGTSYVTLPANTNYDIMGGDFTIEFWWNWQKGNTMSFSGIQIATNFVSSVGWYISAESGSADSITGITFGTFTTGYNSVSNTALNSSNMRRGTWNHIAIVRSGSGSGNLKFYLNGVNVGGAFNAPPAYSGAGNQLAFGVYLQNLTYAGNPDMYISNFRIVRDRALYTSNFTPSTAPLTAVAGTVLLTHQDDRLVDNSAINAQYSQGTAGTTVQPYSPLIPSITTPPVTYSNWFNGSTGYLFAAGNAAFALGTGDFCIEAWINPNSISAVNSSRVVATSDFNGTGFDLSLNSGNAQLYLAGTGYFINTIPLRTWSHVVYTRTSGVIRGFLNGVLSSYTTGSTQDITATTTLYIGVGYSGLYFDGCISNLRVVKSNVPTAYQTSVTTTGTSVFTSPTSPLTNVSGTSLLTCQSSTFIDNSTANGGAGFTLTPTGAVSPVASPVPFAASVNQTTAVYDPTSIGGSAYFDGSGDYLTVPDNANLRPPNGDFTYEIWWYPTSLSGIQGIFTKGNGVQIFLAGGIMNCAFSSNNTTSYFINAGFGAAAPLVNTWNHIAVVRSGNNYFGFLNGFRTLLGTSTSFPGTGTDAVGIGAYNTGLYPSSGYLSGARYVTSALYTSFFVPPIAPPTPVTNTQLLCNFTNAAIIDNTSKNVLETLGSAQISTVQSKWGGRSISFNGTNSYLQIPSSPTFAMGGGNWTVEMWLYPNSIASLQGLLSFGAGSWRLFLNNAGLWFLNGGSGIINVATAVTTGQWYHIALVKAGTGTNQTSLYLNGVLIGSGTDANTYAPGIAYVGSEGAGSYLNGFIDDLRITKAARYTGNFTPPTSQLQDQ